MGTEQQPEQPEQPEHAEAEAPAGVPAAMISRLIPRYAEPHRRYHTWSHIAHVFSASEQISEDRSRALALAIFYHDAVYHPIRQDNEKQSAELLRLEGRRFGLPGSEVEEAAALVMLTERRGPAVALLGPDGERGRILLDADLSILGQSVDVFDAYERAVSQEHAVFPEALFRAGRIQLLESILRQPFIFLTERGRELWEAPARQNLARSIARLKGHEDGGASSGRG